MSKTPIKIITCLLVIGFNLIACNAPADISGRLEGIEREDIKVYLIEPETLQQVAASYLGKVIDSAVIDTDGSFEFRNVPKNKETVLLELAVQPKAKAGNYLQNDDSNRANYMPIVLKSGEPLHITARVDEFQKSFKIENPSEINNALLEVRGIKAKAYQTYLAEKHWQIEEGNELMEKEHAILQYKTALMNFADTTQHLLPALVATRWVSPENDYERVPEFLVNQCEKWNKKQSNNPWVQQLCKLSEPENLPVLIGDEFPNLILPMLTQETLHLKEVLGKKLTIIDLWASWCAPCRLENRKVLVPLWDEYYDQGLQIVAYALESDEASWKAAAERDGANRWYQTSDLQGDDAPFLKKIRVRTIPANFILDENGVIIAKNIHGEDLMDLVKNHFKK